MSYQLSAHPLDHHKQPDFFAERPLGCNHTVFAAFFKVVKNDMGSRSEEAHLNVCPMLFVSNKM